jgi:hypothetical protein
MNTVTPEPMCLRHSVSFSETELEKMKILRNADAELAERVILMGPEEPECTIVN